MASQTSTRIRLGSVAGTPVWLERSWFLIAAVVTVLAASTVQSSSLSITGGAAYAVGFVFALLLLGSVFLHEVSHAVAARAVGIPPTDIVLDLWGGHTAFSREVPSPGRSILVAGVGPLTNGLLALVAALLVPVAPDGGVVDVLLQMLAYSNGFVAVLNALPGLPLDGGRVLEGIVWAIRGRRATGTIAAGRVGQAVAVGIALWIVVRPVLQGRPIGIFTAVWTLLICWMLWQGATGAIRMVAFREAADTLSAGSLMTPAVAVPSTATVADVHTAWWSPEGRTLAAQGRGGPAVVVLDPYGRPAAVVDPAAVSAVPQDRSASVPVASVTRALPGEVLDPRLVGVDLVRRLQEAPATEYAVVDDGRVVGVLAAQTVAEALSRA